MVFGFGLYRGIWQFLNSQRINKVLFPKLKQFINESEGKSYNETEAQAYEMVKAAYSDYTEKFNKLNKLYWTSIRLSFVFPLIAIVLFCTAPNWAKNSYGVHSIFSSIQLRR